MYIIQTTKLGYKTLYNVPETTMALAYSFLVTLIDHYERLRATLSHALTKDFINFKLLFYN